MIFTDRLKGFRKISEKEISYITSTDTFKYFDEKDIYYIIELTYMEYSKIYILMHNYTVTRHRFTYNKSVTTYSNNPLLQDEVEKIGFMPNFGSRLQETETIVYFVFKTLDHTKINRIVKVYTIDEITDKQLKVKILTGIMGDKNEMV